MISGFYFPFSDEGEWCLTCNMGTFDLIVLQSNHISLLQFCLSQLQEHFDKHLTIAPQSEVRVLDWRFVETEVPVLCCKNDGAKA